MELKSKEEWKFFPKLKQCDTIMKGLCSIGCLVRRAIQKNIWITKRLKPALHLDLRGGGQYCDKLNSDTFLYRQESTAKNLSEPDISSQRQPMAVGQALPDNIILNSTYFLLIHVHFLFLLQWGVNVISLDLKLLAWRERKRTKREKHAVLQRLSGVGLNGCSVQARTELSPKGGLNRW